MTPEEYEKFVCEKFAQKGYRTELTPYQNDYGIDLFAYKLKEKIGVQVKMFGNSGRKINRQMIMELHGAKDYFDCTKAMLATNGQVIDNAKEVAEKLGIEILFFDPAEKLSVNRSGTATNKFDFIWTNYIQPLVGETLMREDGKTNKILAVDWGGIERLTSNGRKQTIKIEIFRLAINKILTEGSITRSSINLEYKERASSGVVLVLSQVPFLDYFDNPSRVELNKEKYQNYVERKSIDSKVTG